MVKRREFISKTTTDFHDRSALDTYRSHFRVQPFNLPAGCVQPFVIGNLSYARNFIDTRGNPVCSGDHFQRLPCSTRRRRSALRGPQQHYECQRHGEHGRSRWRVHDGKPKTNFANGNGLHEWWPRDEPVEWHGKHRLPKKPKFTGVHARCPSKLEQCCSADTTAIRLGRNAI